MIDDGVDVDHPDLNVAGVANCVNPGSSEVDGDELDPRAGPSPGYHGTMIAGFIGAVDNAIGVVGVAPGARIWGIQASNANGVLTLSRVLCGPELGRRPRRHHRGGEHELRRRPEEDGALCGAGPDWAAQGSARSGARGDLRPRPGRYHAGRRRRQPSTDEPHDPAAFPEVIGVSAIGDDDGQPGGLSPYVTCNSGDYTEQPDDAFTFFSNYGSWVDIAAPGVCLTSTYPGGIYACGSCGTSYATPLVAGAAALYLHNHPGATPAEVRAALLASAEPGPIPGDPDAFPEGVVNVAGL